jgi:hypothetical protein
MDLNKRTRYGLLLRACLTFFAVLRYGSVDCGAEPASIPRRSGESSRSVAQQDGA